MTTTAVEEAAADLLDRACDEMLVRGWHLVREDQG
jgi:hypothetical protein